jgi:uncharacterized damage-inducible protein DinB
MTFAMPESRDNSRRFRFGCKLGGMDLSSHFQMLARYNRIANERLFAKCAQLDDAEYRKPRVGSFGSIHGLLNHILLGDRRWMGLFEGGQRETPPLDQILYEDFSALRSARLREDARMESFFAGLDAAFWIRPLAYTNNRGKDYVETAHVACSHLFNHQTHHRGQVHAMLSQTPVAPPSLDLHRIINP